MRDIKYKLNKSPFRENGSYVHCESLPLLNKQLQNFLDLMGGRGRRRENVFQTEPKLNDRN